MNGKKANTEFPLTLQNAGNYISSDFLSQLEGFEVAVSEDKKTVNVKTNRVKDEDAFLDEDENIINNKENPSNYIYAVKFFHLMYFLSFDKTEAETKLKEFNNGNDIGDFYLSTDPMNVHINKDLIKFNDETNQILKKRLTS